MSLNERLNEQPQQEPHLSPSKTNRYFGPAVQAGIVLSFTLALPLLLISVLNPFAGVLVHTLLAVLFFVSNIISLLYYIAAVFRMKQQAAEERDLPRQQAIKKKTYALLFMMGLGLAIGLVIAISFTLVTGVITASSVINGTLFVFFMGGMFLSLACRLNPDGKNKGEIVAIYAAVALCIILALVIAIGFPQLIPTLSHLSKYTYLGINLFAGALFAIIASASYIGKMIDFCRYKKPTTETDKEREKKKGGASISLRLWEHRLSIAGLVLGTLVVILIFALHLNPFGGGTFVTICAAIMAFAACASIPSKIGRSIDEATLTNPPDTTWATRVTEHSLWRYFLYPALITLVFLSLGFALYAHSSIAIQGSFLILPWAFGSPIFAISIAALAVACIVNLIAKLKPSVKNIVSCQAIASVSAADKLLHSVANADAVAAQPHLSQALLQHAERFKKLLSPAWRKCISWPAEEVPRTKKQENDLLDHDYNALNDLTTRKQITNEDIQTLKDIISTLKEIKIDPTYRPDFSLEKFIPLSILSFSSFLSCVTFLFLILTNTVSVATTLWMLPLAAIFGLVSWGIAHYLQENTKGGSYSSWTLIFGVSTVVFFALAFITAAGIPIVGVSLSAIAPVFWLSAFGCLLISALFFRTAYRHAAQFDSVKNHTAEFLAEKNKHEERAAIALTIFKVLLMMGFLLLSFLCLALLLNLGGIGAFSHLGTLATNLFVKLLGPSGLKSLGVLTIGVFTTANIIAFELFKSILTKTPTTALEATEPSDWSKLAILIFKFILIGATIIALTAMPSSLLLGAHTAMLPVFLVVMLVMPLFADNADLPFRSKSKFVKWLNDGFNYLFGFKKGKFNAEDFLRQESCTVLFLAGVSVFVAYAAGATALLAAPVCAIAAVVTLFFRWRAMYFSREEPNEIERALSPAEKSEREIGTKNFLIRLRNFFLGNTPTNLAFRLGNLAFGTTTIVMGFLFGVTSPVFIALSAVSFLFGLAQFAANKWQLRRATSENIKIAEAADHSSEEQEKKEKKEEQEEQEEKKEEQEEKKEEQEEKKEEPPENFLYNSVKNQEEKTQSLTLPEKIDPTRFFNINTTENRGVSQSNALTQFIYVVGGISGVITHGNGLFANNYFGMAWNLVDAMGCTPSIYANAKNHWENRGTEEEALLIFESTAAIFLTISTVLSTIAKENPHLIGGNIPLIASLEGFGFALSMTASAARSLSDLWHAQNQCSAYFLLTNNIAHYKAVENDPVLKAQLREKILAIYRVKQADLSVTEKSAVDEIFESANISLKERDRPASPEEIRYVTTLFTENEKKRDKELANFVGFLAAAICFWLLAVGVSLSLVSFGGGTHIFLVISTVIKAGQFLSSGVDWFQDKHMAFMSGAAEKINTDRPEHTALGDSAFLDSLYTANTTTRDNLFKAATDELIILVKNTRDDNVDQSLDEAIEKTLTMLRTENSAAYQLSSQKLALLLNDEVTKEAVAKSSANELINAGFFSSGKHSNNRGLDDQTPSFSRPNFCDTATVN